MYYLYEPKSVDTGIVIAIADYNGIIGLHRIQDQYSSNGIKTRIGYADSANSTLRVESTEVQ